MTPKERVVAALNHTEPDRVPTGENQIDGTFPWRQTVGMEQFLMFMITNPDFVRRAIEVYVNRSIEYIKLMLAAGADAIMTTADYCDNRGPIMGEKLFRKFILPGIQRQCDVIHNLAWNSTEYWNGFGIA